MGKWNRPERPAPHPSDDPWETEDHLTRQVLDAVSAHRHESDVSQANRQVNHDGSKRPKVRCVQQSEARQNRFKAFGG